MLNIIMGQFYVKINNVLYQIKERELSTEWAVFFNPTSQQIPTFNLTFGLNKAMC